MDFDVNEFFWKRNWGFISDSFLKLFVVCRVFIKNTYSKIIRVYFGGNYLKIGICFKYGVGMMYKGEVFLFFKLFSLVDRVGVFRNSGGVEYWWGG